MDIFSCNKVSRNILLPGLFLFILSVWVFYLHVCLCCAHVYSVWKLEVRLLELESWMVVSCYVDAQIEIQSLL